MNHNTVTVTVETNSGPMRVTVNIEQIARRLGYRARHAKTKRATVLYGCVRVDAVGEG